jgi:uncharacterized membrane protein YfcA
VTTPVTRDKYAGLAFAWGTAIGSLGGLIGLGGAEFRLPVLLSFFKLSVFQALVINLMVSLVTVVFSLLFRAGLGRVEIRLDYAPVVLNILGGALIGSYAGTHLVTRIPDRTLLRVMSLCLVGLSVVLMGHEVMLHSDVVTLPDGVRLVAGLAAGVAIGLLSSLLGVAGGEMIIPTLILLYGIEAKVAGSVSLVISIPTILVGLLRYRAALRVRDWRPPPRFVASMAGGSIAGALIGSALLPYVPGSLLTAFLGIILLVSAIRLYRQGEIHTHIRVR